MAWATQRAWADLAQCWAQSSPVICLPNFPFTMPCSLSQLPTLWWQRLASRWIAARARARRWPPRYRPSGPSGCASVRKTTMSQDQTGNNAFTSGIANFVAGLRYEDIPHEVKDRIKLLILDSLGCAIFGVHLEWSQILIQTLTKLDSTTACRIWGSAKRISAPHAVLVNGALVQSFELDDVHRQGVLHVGAVTLPPLFALAELKPGMTGRDFLTAAVAGYEVGPRVGMCMGQEHIVQGWHSGATVGVFSAAAGAAAALKLSPQQTVHALGIAGTQAAGLMAAQFGAMVKRMHAGRSAQSGLYGALLAERGFTGITDVFESPYGGARPTSVASPARAHPPGRPPGSVASFLRRTDS